MRILLIPHIGTAFGHFFRLIQYAHHKYNSPEYQVYIIIPQPLIGSLTDHIPNWIHIVPRVANSSVHSDKGDLNVEGFKAVLGENQIIIDSIKPELIIGDPGIQAAILGVKNNVEWHGLMHGCYLPLPKLLNLPPTLLNTLYILNELISSNLDLLIKTATKGEFSKWEDLRLTGKTIIMNSLPIYDIAIGESLLLNDGIVSWQNEEPVDFLITCSSTGNYKPDNEFLSRLNLIIPNITIAGSSLVIDNRISNIRNIGNKTSYYSLTNENTSVITHCGHGTLFAIRRALKVYMIPGDLDQLFNSILAFSSKNWKLIFDRDWDSTINSPFPFVRSYNWKNIKINLVNNELELMGVNNYSPILYESMMA